MVIVWYIDTAAVDDQSNRLRELLAAGALGFGEGKKDALEKQLIPIFDGIRETLKQPGLGEVDCGQGIAQATLMAFEQGLGTCCLGSPNLDQIRINLGLPDTAASLAAADRRLPGGEPRGRRAAPAPAVRRALPHEPLRQAVPAHGGGGGRAEA